MARGTRGTAIHRPKPEAVQVLDANRRNHELLVEVARQHADRGDAERVLRSAMVAANYAWLAPTGLLSDIRLERAVVHAVRGTGTVTVDGGRDRGRVLHVLSEAYGIGGHTRQATRWIKRDPRTSDVVLTNQLGEVPEALREVVRTAGGELHDLRSTTSGLLDRARALRRHMDRADLVVLTVHPYDSVVLAAVNLPGVRPPVLYANHADLGFWLGVAGTDLVCDLRPEARRLDESLRGVPAERIGVLPLPVDELASQEGDRLRRELGIRPDAVVAVTVADDWKVAATWGRGMHQLLDDVLHWTPQLTAVLVGVSLDDDWARLRKRHPGRFLSVGKVPDPAPYLALADMYLESYPTRAGTTPLEAAMVGLPVLALADLPEDDPVRLFQTSSPGLAGNAVATSAGEFTRAVRRLAADPDRRRAAGAEVRAAVLDVHDGPGWLAALETVYAQARAMPAVDVDDLADSPTDDRYGAMLLSALGTVAGSPDPRALAGCLGDLFDNALHADVFAATSRTGDPSFRVRVVQGWAEHPEWTCRLLELSSTHPRLVVSLPLVPGDDARGGRTEALLLDLLARIGRTADDCGDVRVESTAPPTSGLQLAAELPATDMALHRLDELLSSPLWTPADPDPDPSAAERAVRSGSPVAAG
jgi:hypothetical protein